MSILDSPSKLKRILSSEDATKPELWLVKVPRSLGSLPLEGAKFKLPNERDECGRVMSKLEGGLELRLGDVSEHKRLRALFLDEGQQEVQPAGGDCAKSKKLRLVGPFSGQLNLVRRSAEAGEILKSSDEKSLKNNIKETTHEVFVEPYCGLQQKTGLRVRSLLPGTKVKCKKWNSQSKAPLMNKKKSRQAGKKKEHHKKKTKKT
eukprot:7912_1